MIRRISRCGNSPVKTLPWRAKLAREFDVPMKLAHTVLAEMTEAINRGWGHRDSRVAMMLQNERAGVDIKVDSARLDEIVEND